MAAEEFSSEHDLKRSKGMRDNSFMGGIYGMSFIGAAIYFIGHASSFWVGVLGFFKAIFWPAVIMYKVLEILNM